MAFGSGAATGAAAGSVLGPIGTGIGAVLGGIGGWLSGRSKDKAEKQQRELENQYIQQQDAAKRDLIARLQAAGYDPFGPQTATRTGTETGTSTTDMLQRVNMFNRPEILAQYAPMEARYRQLIEGRLGRPSPVTEGEIASTLRGINRASEGAMRQVQNIAGGRGLSAQQLQAAGTPIATARTGQIADFLASIPQVERQRQAEDLAMAQGAIGAFGTGQRQTGTTRTTGTESRMGQSFGSSTQGPDIGALMALTAPSGPMQTLNTGSSPWGYALQQAGPLVAGLGQYYGNRQQQQPMPIGPTRRVGPQYPLGG